MIKSLRLIGFVLACLMTTTSWSQNCVTDWQYQVPIVIANPNATALTDFQVQIQFDSQSLITAGKMNANASDLRFAEDCCNLLCHWIQDGVNTTTTNVWVNVDSIPALGADTIYMYYGNTAAQDASDGACTFDLFENFAGGTMTQFTDNCGNNTVSYAGDVMTVNWSSNGVHTSNNTFPQGNIYTVEADVTAASGSWPALYWIKTSNDDNYGLMINSTQVRISVVGSGAGACAGHNWASGLVSYTSPVGIWSFTWRGTGDQIGDFPTVGAISSTDNLYPLDSDLRLGFGGISNGTGSLSMDWIRVRKYAATTPTYVLGSEAMTSITAVNVTAPDTAFCAGSTLTLDAGAGLASYTWSTAETTQTIDVGTAGWYSVTAADAGGCISSDSIEIAELAAPVVDLGADVTVCVGESTTLDAGTGPGFASYAWSSGGTSQMETVSTAGTYSVVVTDSNTCTGSDTIDVLNYAAVTAAFTSSGTGLAYTFTNGSTNGVTYSWDFGDGNTSTDTDPTHTYASTGTYTVCLIATSADGCVDSTCADVTVSIAGIDENTSLHFSLYPNPADESVQITSTYHEACEFNVVDVNGKIVASGSFEPGVNDIDVKKMEAGIYMIQLSIGKSLRLVVK